MQGLVIAKVVYSPNYVRDENRVLPRKVHNRKATDCNWAGGVCGCRLQS